MLYHRQRKPCVCTHVYWFDCTCLLLCSECSFIHARYTTDNRMHTCCTRITSVQVWPLSQNNFEQMYSNCSLSKQFFFPWHAGSLPRFGCTPSAHAQHRHSRSRHHPTTAMDVAVARHARVRMTGTGLKKTVGFRNAWCRNDWNDSSKVELLVRCCTSKVSIGKINNQLAVAHAPPQKNGLQLKSVLNLWNTPNQTARPIQSRAIVNPKPRVNWKFRVAGFIHAFHTCLVDTLSFWAMHLTNSNGATEAPQTIPDIEPAAACCNVVVSPVISRARE